MSEIICNNTTTFLARRLFDNGESLVRKDDTYKRVGTIEGLITTLTLTGRDKNIYSFRIIDEQRQPYKDLTRIICNRLGGASRKTVQAQSVRYSWISKVIGLCLRIVVILITIQLWSFIKLAFTHKTKKPRPKPGQPRAFWLESTIVEIWLCKSV